MPHEFENRIKNMGNDVDVLKLLRYLQHSIRQKRHKYVANKLNILNMAQMCFKPLKYNKNGFTMLEMA